MSTSVFPTSGQVEAIGTLKDHDYRDILAWLAFARSIVPGFQRSYSAGGLANPQIDAVMALRCCSNERLLMWLDMAHSASKEVQQGPDDSFAKSGPRPSSNTLRKASSCLKTNPYSTLGITKSQGSFIRKSNRNTPRKISGKDNNYWCTVCEHPHGYKNSDDWKKHEKEHETKYICGLGELTEIKEDKVICVLCGIVDPDGSHLETHNMDSCRTMKGGPPSFKRRYDVVTHLVQHHEAIDCNAIAEKWRYTPKKQAWSCGFCICQLSTLAERLKHIDHEHFRRHQSIREWETTKIIRGLLLQPKVHESWKNLLASCGLVDTEFSWSRHDAKSLQYKLEMGPSAELTPQDLAKAAYDSANIDWAAYDLIDYPLTVPVFADQAGARLDLNPAQNQALMVSASGSDSGTTAAATISFDAPVLPSSLPLAQSWDTAQKCGPRFQHPYPTPEPANPISSGRSVDAFDQMAATDGFAVYQTYPIT